MTIKCHFDGKVFIPDEPVDLPAGANLDMHIESQESGYAPGVLPHQGRGTVAEVLASGAIGGWAHRSELVDGRAFVDQLRADRRRRRSAS
jgi:hypothetical protein